MPMAHVQPVDVTLTVTATNGVGTPATQNFTLTVVEGSEPITFSSETDRVYTSGARVVVRTTSVEYLDAWREREIDVDFMVSSELETANAIVAEALANAAKHSGAPEVSVRIIAGLEELRIEVEDRGSGVVNAEVGTGGFHRVEDARQVCGQRLGVVRKITVGLAIQLFYFGYTQSFQ